MHAICVSVHNIHPRALVFLSYELLVFAVLTANQSSQVRCLFIRGLNPFMHALASRDLSDNYPTAVMHAASSPVLK